MVHSQSQLAPLSAAGAQSPVSHETESIRSKDATTKTTTDNVSAFAGFGTIPLEDIQKLNASKSSDLEGTGLKKVSVDFADEYKGSFPEFRDFGKATNQGEMHKTTVGEAGKHDSAETDHFSLDGKLRGDQPKAADDKPLVAGDKGKAAPVQLDRPETATPMTAALHAALGKVGAHPTNHSIGMAAALSAQQEAAKAKPVAPTGQNQNHHRPISRRHR